MQHNRIGTLFAFLGYKLVDPSIALPLASVYIVYLVLYDVWKTKNQKKSMRDSAAPIALVMLGIVGAWAEPIGSAAISVAALLFIVVLSQGSTAIAQIAYERGVDTTDSVNFFFWRLAWSAVVATASVIVVAVLTNRALAIIAALESSFLALILWLPIRMVLLYLSEVSRGRAYQAGGPTSEVAALRTSQVMLAVPITLLVSSIAPQAFGSISTDPLIWIIRFLGAGLILSGVIMLYRRRSSKHCTDA